VTAPPEYLVDFPTLWVAADWIEAHCVVPDGFRAGEPFEMYDWQLWCTVNHYRVKRSAVWRPEQPMLATAFHNRRSQVVGPQKTGKGPWTACICSLEGAGPALFAGWAGEGDGYACSDHGCGCGWEYEYQPGEPMGMRWPTPLIQITATSEDQTDNVFRPLQAMIRLGPLGDLMRAGEEFVRVGLEGRIDVVTSSAQSRLGNPVTFALQDETGLWTKTNKMLRVADTQRRGVAGMGGRSMETTNPWDPSEQSVAQQTAESSARDVFRFHRPPPKGLRYTVKAERRRIHRHVYAGCRHIDLDAIEGEAAELLERDPQQAERFFGNRVVYGQGSWCDGERWDTRAAPRVVPDGTPVVLGFDGSDVDDWTGIRAETQDGYQFTPTYGPDQRPTIWDPAEFDGQVPRLEVAAAVDELMARLKVIRMYADPPDWKSEIDDWAAQYGEKRVVRWETYRPVQMHAAAQRLLTDVGKSDSTFTHDGCPTTAIHVRNARKVARPGQRYVLAKPTAGQKIDLCVTSVICHEAAGDVTAAKLWLGERRLTRVVGRVSGY
jgi:hypothetical protein